MILKQAIDSVTIKNLKIISFHNEDNEVVFYRIYPEEGYVIRTPNLDVVVKDEDENVVISDNGKMFIKRAYAAAMTELPSYNWQENPEEYAAVPYYEGIYDEQIEVDVPIAATEIDYINALEELGVNFNE